jgi:endonuclease YncB( thermonuclease family)
MVLAAVPALAAGIEITGKAKVIDGMTMEVEGRRVRLYGVDAPDLEQTCQWPDRTIPCGKLAKLALMDLTTGGAVACRPRAKDADGSLIAICFSGGFDIGKNMVHTGWAMTDRRVSRPYIETEQKSRTAKRGMWRGAFVRPSDWRQGKRNPVK